MTHCPPDATTKQFVVHRLLPRTPLDYGVVVHYGLHVPMTSTVSKGVVQHPAGAQRPQLLHPALLRIPPIVLS
ncbi:MAG: hypothetical protein MKZ77_10660, partial [Acidimicrobiales bacterium]|nr:hypothetical protein [Acidimicrobiales bacterium]